MFKFTIRELLLLTLVVGLGLSWGLRERQLRAELVRAKQWRTAAGALEEFLTDQGFTVAWGVSSEFVRVTGPRGGLADYNVTAFEPSADEP